MPQALVFDHQLHRLLFFVVVGVNVGVIVNAKQECWRWLTAASLLQFWNTAAPSVLRRSAPLRNLDINVHQSC